MCVREREPELPAMPCVWVPCGVVALCWLGLAFSDALHPPPPPTHPFLKEFCCSPSSSSSSLLSSSRACRLSSPSSLLFSPPFCNRIIYIARRLLLLRPHLCWQPLPTHLTSGQPCVGLSRHSCIGSLLADKTALAISTTQR